MFVVVTVHPNFTSLEKLWLSYVVPKSNRVVYNTPKKTKTKTKPSYKGSPSFYLSGTVVCGLTDAMSIIPHFSTSTATLE